MCVYIQDIYCIIYHLHICHIISVWTSIHLYTHRPPTHHHQGFPGNLTKEYAGYPIVAPGLRGWYPWIKATVGCGENHTFWCWFFLLRKGAVSFIQGNSFVSSTSVSGFAVRVPGRCWHPWFVRWLVQYLYCIRLSVAFNNTCWLCLYVYDGLDHDFAQWALDNTCGHLYSLASCGFWLILGLSSIIVRNAQNHSKILAKVLSALFGALWISGVFGGFLGWETGASPISP